MAAVDYTLPQPLTAEQCCQYTTQIIFGRVVPVNIRHVLVQHKRLLGIQTAL